MEFDHGFATTPLVHKMSALEFAIHNFSRQAKAHHELKGVLAKVIDETEAQKKRRETMYEAEKRHFENERRIAETICEVQVKLQLYQEKNRGSDSETRGEFLARRNKMEKEKHRPTSVLANYLRAVGRAKPSPWHSPHHIVPGKGRTKAAYRARILLHTLGIGINDPDNGVWLIHKKADKGHWSMPISDAHLEIHTENYESWIERHLNQAPTETLARQKLSYIRGLLQSGAQPANVTMPPDKSWKEL